jgi:hypothetical protein
MNVQRTLLTKMIAGRGLFSQQRAFSSVAYNVKSKFEAAYAEKLDNLKKVTTAG